ncbi:MAG: YbgC/FadM family acyl-CoA thioesterase [Gammaproteobacteria bacterium]|nr:YbgC/FadM family acyl-CoA thioesterase [Gammaproteobacteria bacterium]
MKSTCRFVLEKQRIYYEDTDAGGVVYHSNYLKLMDRARCEWLWKMGICFNQLAEDACLFVVCDVHVKYLKPMRLQDIVDVSAEVIKLGNTSVVFAQKIYKHQDSDCVYASGEVTVVSINNKGKPIRLPEMFRSQVS